MFDRGFQEKINIDHHFLREFSNKKNRKKTIREILKT